ncbi:MAG: monofunctional biosynthetic peptidoglycan transglycosylase [Bacteroidetes bacterium]|nr:monofunctional biosynthetic peptidoglycan transglycosylase [Bacteroidota bacterium]MBL0066323.1 monofunctional biosynthetic peptidoglycan transglycosylase [Bacteroidota bacterium]MBL0139025.1 monofunctional biosynthetic peptidoglycan transglycosylase [Bacteroidota bacterium]
MIKKILRILLKTVLWFLGLSVASVILFRFVPVPVTPLMLIRCVEQKSDGKSMKLKKDWTPIDEMSATMPLAVIASEDQNFEEHFGFDLDAIRKAQQYNERHKGKRMKGASTISQQTAKNVFLWPSRSWIRKGFEVYFTFLIEIFWSKQRIMEVYLNVIEMGDGVYGAEAAAQEYFHKPSKKLSVREAALIAAVLPNPRKWSPAKPTAYIQRKSGRIVHFMSRLQLEDF